MKAIYKYSLAITADQSLFIHCDAQILDAQAQHGEICLWAQVDHSQVCEEYVFRIYGTGTPVPDDLPYPYISTVQLNGLVWHIYGGPKW